MIRKALVIITTIVVLFSVGSSQPYDDEAFRYIEDYYGEIVPAVSAAILDLQDWLNEPEITDEAMVEIFEYHADLITEINWRYWAEDFPVDTVVEKWRIVQKIGNGMVKRIDGKESADALWFTGANSDALAKTL